MTASASTFNADLRPQRPEGLGLGALLSLLAHGVLVLALALAVRWRTTEPEGVSAELWAAVPQVAAPPAAQPSPTPPPEPERAPPPRPAPPPPQAQEAEAQIAVDKARKLEREKALREQQEQQAKADKLKAEKAEREEKLKADKQKAEADKQKREQEQKAAETRLAQQREENLKRMLGQVGGTGAPGSTGTAQRDAGPSAGYAGRIKARIKPNIVLTEDVAGNPAAEVEVRCAPDGTIVGRQLRKSSGNKDWDEAVLRAIDRTEVLPRDTDGRVPAAILITFRPKE
jgi:colicin import membrane protein